MLTNAQPDDRIFTAQHVLVVHTCVVQQRDGSHAYEIHLAPDAEDGARLTVLRTEDEQAYQLALELEGKANARVSASWYHRRRGSQRFAVLDTLEVAA
jgi:predicted hotdog family 3-hydroxylacyl-ACP dehydratase